MSNQRTLKEAKEYLNAKEYDKAVEVCKEILMWNSANFHAHVFLGLAYQNLRKWDDSEKSYQKAIEIEKDNILGYQVK